MTAEWEAEAARGWADLERRLAEWLEDGPPDGYVIIEMQSGGPDVWPRVQLVIEDFDVRTEAISNHYLAAAFRLTPEREAQLVALGWRAPNLTGQEEHYDGSVNFWSDDELPDCAGRIAERLVRTLRDGYGIPAPDFLTVHAFDDDGAWADDDVPLGLRIVDPRAQHAGCEPEADPLAVVVPADADHLRDLVKAAVEEVTGLQAEFDADGDIPITTGTSMVFVAVDDDQPVVRLYAPLLYDVRWHPRVGHELNAVNAAAYYFRVVFHNGFVRMEFELEAQPFVPQLLHSALRGMCSMADTLAPQLKERLRGNLFDERPGRPGRLA